LREEGAMHCAERAVAVASNALSIFRLFMGYPECTMPMNDGAFENRFQKNLSGRAGEGRAGEGRAVKALLVNILWKLKYPLGTNFRG